MSDEHDELRRLFGGYLLGGLDEADTDRLDAHLGTCDSCRLELDRLAPVPEMLRQLPEAQRADAPDAPASVNLAARPSPQRIEEMLGKMRAQRTRERRLAGVRWLAAAAVVLIAALIGFSVITSDRGGRPPQVLPSPQLVTAQFESEEGSGLTGEAVLTPKTWGVSIALDVSRLEGAGPFVCQVHGGGGQVEQAAVWGTTPDGDVKVIGASSMQLASVSSITVSDRNGRVLGEAHVS
ncbi:zf-HC2 domain-containing protein [Mangrovihabitans endophyticus]|uniref:Putative zinc-finger domain-containing protein n=1 Tax=Mangrovihabitans endophyticus TaxID=1751298 RepID=A0A8J3BZS4_9ACTN|nr:zf-HC2 domain-containing protein [Mangrovihabitans endophyticus]GGK98209.1 hypothetical protein GCM10012284_35570 [Mangrovihabitans endophyticus]